MLKPTRRAFLYRCEVIFVALDLSVFWFQCPKGHVFEQEPFTSRVKGIRSRVDPAAVQQMSRWWSVPFDGHGKSGVDAACPICEHGLGFSAPRSKIIKRP